MSVSPYITFDGNCKEAVTFYTEVFETDSPIFATFGDFESPAFQLDEKTKSLIMHTQLWISNDSILFSDNFPGVPYSAQGNISIAISEKDGSLIRKYFERMKAGGTIIMELSATEWSPCYGMLTDKFGIKWQFNQLV